VLRKNSHAVPCQLAVPLLVCAIMTDEPSSEYCAEKLFWSTRTSSRESGFGTTEFAVMLPVFSFHTPSST
jgi:predicted membrane-bound spermidine synthase